MFDLKSFREESKYKTQKEFAELIGVRQDAISRMEKNPETIGLEVLIKIANATGTSLDELVGYKKTFPEALEVEDTWESVEFMKRNITDYIAKYIESHSVKDDYSMMIEEVEALVSKGLRKPKMAIVGLSDSGKSTLINSLLGEEKMPTSWTPTTAISVYLKHIDDRPEFINDDVWIMKSQVGEEIGWDPNRLEDEAYCRAWFVEEGHLSILEKYAVRDGENTNDIGGAIVYLDSPILKVCDIIDLPGFGTGDRELDDQLSSKARAYADVVVYMSISNGFLRGNDIEFLKSVLNTLPAVEHESNGRNPLSNLYIVASQAHVIHRGNRAELNRIMDEGAKRLYSQVPEEIWGNRSEMTGLSYSLETLRSRFFTYTKDIDGLRKSYEESLIEYVESYPEVLCTKFKKALNEICNSNKVRIENEIRKFENIIEEREEYKILIQEIDKAEPKRKNESIKLKKIVEDKIYELEKESKKAFSIQYDNLISVDSIVEIIDEKGYTKKKEDSELLGGFLTSTLQARLQKVLKEKSMVLNDEINAYIENYDSLVKEIFDIESTNIDVAFDVERVFASGLAGLATFGGLAVWASTMGNLGAYILVAKGVSLLSAIGISVSGGTAGAAAAVAAIGGPVVLGIALAAIGALAVFALLGVSWKTSVAKKIIKTYSDDKVFAKFEYAITEYWRDTSVAFEAASTQLESGYEKYKTDLENMVNNYNEKSIQKEIKAARELHNFFVGMPF